MSESYAVEIKNVSKRLDENQVLDKVNLKCAEGSITGIIGRNGSGKSVLFKCICGFFKPDEGDIILHGMNNTDYIEGISRLGAIIEEPAFLKQYSGIKNLELLYLVRNKANREHLINTLNLVGLNSSMNKKVGKYSMGMKQRLAIAQAIMEEQEILIFDEPMNGLDSDGVEHIKGLFLDLKAQGKTIILSSHVKEDLEQLCENIYKMEHASLQLMN